MSGILAVIFSAIAAICSLIAAVCSLVNLLFNRPKLCIFLIDKEEKRKLKLKPTKEFCFPIRIRNSGGRTTGVFRVTISFPQSFKVFKEKECSKEARRKINRVKNLRRPIDVIEPGRIIVHPEPIIRGSTIIFWRKGIFDWELSTGDHLDFVVCGLAPERVGAYKVTVNVYTTYKTFTEKLWVEVT